MGEKVIINIKTFADGHGGLRLDLASLWAVKTLGCVLAVAVVIGWDRVAASLVPQETIDRLAREYERRLGADAIEMLLIESDRAFRCCESIDGRCLLRAARAAERIEAQMRP